MIHPVNQAVDLIAWSGRRLAWPAIFVIYVIYIIRGHLGGVPKRDSLNQPFGMTSGGPCMACPLSGASPAPGWPPASLKIGALGGQIW